MKRFPKDIEDFGKLFCEMKIQRESADYDPNSSFTKLEVLSAIEEAKLVIDQMTRQPLKDRRAFAAWIVFRT